MFGADAGGWTYPGLSDTEAEIEMRRRIKQNNKAKWSEDIGKEDEQTLTRRTKAINYYIVAPWSPLKLFMTCESRCSCWCPQPNEENKEEATDRLV